MSVVSWHVACGHAKSCRFMYIAVWVRVAHEEQNVLTLSDLVVSVYSVCGVAIWSAEAASSSSMMYFSLMIVSSPFLFQCPCFESNLACKLLHK